RGARWTDSRHVAWHHRITRPFSRVTPLRDLAADTRGGAERRPADHAPRPPMVLRGALAWHERDRGAPGTTDLGAGRSRVRYPPGETPLPALRRGWDLRRDRRRLRNAHARRPPPRRKPAAPLGRVARRRLLARPDAGGSAKDPVAAPAGTATQRLPRYAA